MDSGSEKRGISIPVVIQAFAFTILGNFADSSYSPLSAFIKGAYSLTAEQVGIITSVVFIGSLTVNFFTGILVDRFGSRSAVKISFALLSIGSLICALSVSYETILSGFFLIGLGYGSITPSTNSLIMEKYFPDHMRRMGLKQSGVPIGSLFAVSLLPLLAIYFGIRWPFFLLFAVTAAVSVLVKRDRVYFGSINFRKYLSDMLETARNHELLLISVFSTVLSWGQQVSLTFWILFMVSNGFLVIVAEISLAIFLMGAVAGRIFWSRIGNALFGGSRKYGLSLIMMISGLLLISISIFHLDTVILVPYAFFLGMNTAGWNSTYVTAVSETAPKKKVGIFSGVGLIILGTGTIIGAPLSGYIKDTTGSFFTMWLVLGTVQVASAIVLSIVTMLTQRRKPSGTSI